MASDASSPLPGLREQGTTVLIKVWASAGASRDRVNGLYGGALKVAVAAAPEKGRANAAIARVLARELGLPARRVRLHSGETAREKWFRIEGITLEEAKAALVRISRGPAE